MFDMWLLINEGRAEGVCVVNSDGTAGGAGAAFNNGDSSGNHGLMGNGGGTAFDIELPVAQHLLQRIAFQW